MEVKEVLAAKLNSEVEGTYVIKDMATKPFRTGDGEFLTGTLHDKTGSISFVMWDDVEKVVKNVSNSDVVHLMGTVSEFQSINQITIKKLRLQDNYDKADFMPASDNAKETIATLKLVMDTIEDADIKKVWEAFANDEEFMDEFYNCPAGKGNTHHAYVHGLLDHTTSMLKVGSAIAEHYPNVNRDILLIGIFLHDVGKIWTYRYDLTIDMKDEGRLHNHSPIGYAQFMLRLGDLEMPNAKRRELAKVIGHIILSHHERHEYQAPVIPMTKEAILVAKIDAMDSLVNYAEGLLPQEEGRWSQYDRLTERFYYRPKIEEATSKKRRKKTNGS